MSASFPGPELGTPIAVEDVAEDGELALRVAFIRFREIAFERRGGWWRGRFGGHAPVFHVMRFPCNSGLACSCVKNDAQPRCRERREDD